VIPSRPFELADRPWGQAGLTVEDVAGNGLSFYAATGSSS